MQAFVAAGLGRRPARADQHDSARPTNRSSTPGDDAARAYGRSICRSATCWQVASLGRPADRVVQWQRHRDRAREPVQRRRMGSDAPGRAPPRRASARRRLAAGLRSRRRCSSGRRLARPTPNAGFDIDGDGLTTIDRLCAGVDPAAVFAVRGNATAIRALNPNGCTQVGINTQRDGFVVNADGSVEERSSRYLNVDLRVTKTFTFGRARLKGYASISTTCSTPRTCISAATRVSD